MSQKGKLGKLNFLLLQRPKGGWVGRCLQYNFVTQAETLEELVYEIDRAVIGHLFISSQMHRRPLEGLKAAPDRYWDMFRHSTLTLRPSKLTATKFHIDPPAGMAFPRQELKVGSAVES